MNDLNNPKIPDYIGPYYVYLLVDPASNEVFYVGKGTGWRFASHLTDKRGYSDITSDADTDDTETRRKKIERIKAIRQRGQEPEVQFARIKITEAEAFSIEAALIDTLKHFGPRAGGGLTNEIGGQGTKNGLVSLDDVSQLLLTPILDTPIPAILFKLREWQTEEEPELPRHGYGYWKGMSDQDLYDSTRAWWSIASYRRPKYHYAVAIFQGITRAVYRIDQSSWRSYKLDPKKVAFAATRLNEGDVFAAFMSDDGKGRRIPLKRPRGDTLFGPQTSRAYWPE